MQKWLDWSVPTCKRKLKVQLQRYCKKGYLKDKQRTSREPYRQGTVVQQEQGNDNETHPGVAANGSGGKWS